MDSRRAALVAMLLTLAAFGAWIASAQPQSLWPANRVELNPTVGGYDRLQDAIDNGAIGGGGFETGQYLASGCTSQVADFLDVCILSQPPNAFFRLICTEPAGCDGVTPFQWRRAEGSVWNVTGDPNTSAPVTANECPESTAAPSNCDCTTNFKDFALWELEPTAPNRYWICTSANLDTWAEITSSPTIPTTHLSANDTAGDCYGAAYTNGAASGEVTLTLCPAVAGMSVWVVWENELLTFNVDPDGTDRILAPDTDTNGDKLTWTQPGIEGSTLHLYSPADNEWRVLNMRGSMAIDGGP